MNDTETTTTEPERPRTVRARKGGTFLVVERIDYQQRSVWIRGVGRVPFGKARREYGMDDI